MAKQKQTAAAAGKKHFPWSHVIGFILSIVLTLLALGVALKSNLSFSLIVAIIVVLAFCQAALQLLMFMHITEREGRVQTGTMLYAAFIAVVVVVGSVWVMTSGHAAH